MQFMLFKQEFSILAFNISSICVTMKQNILSMNGHVVRLLWVFFQDSAYYILKRIRRRDGDDGDLSCLGNSFFSVLQSYHNGSLSKRDMLNFRCANNFTALSINSQQTIHCPYRDEGSQFSA